MCRGRIDYSFACILTHYLDINWTVKFQVNSVGSIVCSTLATETKDIFLQINFFIANPTHLDGDVEFAFSLSP